MRTLLWSLALAGTAALAPTAEAGELWVADYDRAVEIAKKENKDLLVDFTGSDWCGWCIRLDREVFEHDEFLDAARKDYVLVKLDFPRGKEAKATVPNPQRNEELSSKYGIRGFPTILLMTTDGDVFAQTGYEPGGPEKYVSHLRTLRANGKPELNSILELKKAFDAAQGADKEAVLEKAIDKLSRKAATDMGVGHLADIAKFAFEVDPQNTRGLKLRAIRALLDAGKADRETVDAIRPLDPRNEEGLLERSVHAQMFLVQSREDVVEVVEQIYALDALGPMKDKAIAVRLYANVAIWNDGLLKKPEEAREYARKALDLGPDDKRLAGRLEQILEE